MHVVRLRHHPAPTVGVVVVTKEAAPLGDVAALHVESMVVCGGTRDDPVVWRVPRTAITTIDDQGIHLAVSRAQALAEGWEQAAGARDG